MTERETKRYLIVVRIGKNKPDLERLREGIPAVKETLRGFSIGDLQLAFNSHDGATFGMLFKSRYHPNAIVSVLFGNDSTGHNTAVLFNDDNVLLVQLGSQSSCLGLGRAAAWLQHE